MQKTLKEIVDSLTWSVFFYVHLHLICFYPNVAVKLEPTKQFAQKFV